MISSVNWIIARRIATEADKFFVEALIGKSFGCEARKADIDFRL